MPNTPPPRQCDFIFDRRNIRPCGWHKWIADRTHAPANLEINHIEIQVTNCDPIG